MSLLHFDLVVIGSGPGGEGAAMQAAKAGLKVAVVERYSLVGGACTHWGTIPSKALRHAIQELSEFRRNPLFAGSAPILDVGIPDMLAAATSVIEHQVDMRQSFYERNGVEVLRGTAGFTSAHSINVRDANDAVQQIEATNFVIATGSRPYRPTNIDFDHPAIFDADTILKLDHKPKSLLVYGAGVIGCEYASMFRKLGVKVNLINSRDRLLSFLDDEIIDALAYHLRDQGVVIRHNEVCDKVVSDGDKGLVMHTTSGKQIGCDALLWANGRSGNHEDLGLDVLGIEVDSRGNIAVDDLFRTQFPHIYAVGDIIGPPGLASASHTQGRLAARSILGEEPPQREKKGFLTRLFGN